MADHAVGGVDRLVGDRARQAEQDHPEERRHHAVAKALGQAFDGGAADAGFIELLGIASDDHSHRFPAGGEAFGAERVRHGLDVGVQAALGEQGAGENGAQQQRKKIRQEDVAKPRDDEADQQADRDEQQHEDDALRPLLDGRIVL